MMSKTFEELYSELNSMNIQDINNALVEASRNLEQCTEPFAAQDIIKQQQETINRQKAKIKALQMDNKQLATDNFNANMNCEHLQAEIERLQSILLRFMDEVAKWEEKHGLDVSELPLIPICDEGRDIIDHYRKKVVKEFAERLHEYINGIIERHEMPMFPFSVAFVSGMETKIDNLVKEMVGEG